jgi:hypothetical protein
MSLESEALPPNRPTVWLSPKKHKESESMLKEALEKGRIQPSTSAYGAPVCLYQKQIRALGCVWITAAATS